MLQSFEGERRKDGYENIYLNLDDPARYLTFLPQSFRKRLPRT